MLKSWTLHSDCSDSTLSVRYLVVRDSQGLQFEHNWHGLQGHKLIMIQMQQVEVDQPSHTIKVCEHVTCQVQLSDMALWSIHLRDVTRIDVSSA